MNLSSENTPCVSLPTGIRTALADSPNCEERNQVPATVRAVKRILLADDDPGVREMLGRVLESENFEVVPAKTGEETAKRFAAHVPDLVLLDLNMPDGDGWSAFRFINSAQPMLPVIIITASPYEYERAVQLGADALMEKPLNLSLLLQSIRELLAESPSACMARLTNPNFKTNYLKLHHLAGDKDSNS